MSPLSGVLNEAWAMYRRHFQHFIVISFVIYLAVAVVTGLLSWAAGWPGAFIGFFLSLFGMFLLQAALVKAVQDVRDGRVDLDLQATIRAALPNVASVAVAGILAAIGIAVGLALIIVPGLILLTFWALIMPWIVVGGASAMEAFGQSWRTVRGYAWSVFGTLVLLFLILIAADAVVAVILVVLPAGWRNFLSNLISGTLVAPFIAAVVTLIYYRLTAAHGEAAEPGAPPASGYGGGTAPGAPPAPGYEGGTPPGTPPAPGYEGGTAPGTPPAPGYGGSTAPGAPPAPGYEGGTAPGDWPPGPA
jgi:hypothetical protein